MPSGLARFKPDLPILADSGLGRLIIGNRDADMLCVNFTGGDAAYFEYGRFSDGEAAIEKRYKTLRSFFSGGLRRERKAAEAEILLEFEPDVTIQDKNGKTPAECLDKLKPKAKRAALAKAFEALADA